MDIIQGIVFNVVDGDTFDMTVTHVGAENKLDYNDQERIRISEFDAPELNTDKGKRDKIKLENVLLNNNVRVYIEARDIYGRIVGRVQLV